MSFLSGATHVIGNVVGPALEGAGTIYDYATPGKGSSKATNVGKAITNPNVTLSNPANLGFGQSSGFTYAAPATNANTANSTNPAGTSTPSTTTYDPNAYGGYGSAAAQSAAYGTYQTEAQNDLSKLLNSYNNTVAGLNSTYSTKGNELDSAKAAAENSYNTGVTDQNQNLLRQDNSIRQGTYQAYQNLMNLLGAYGGGGTSVAQQWAPTAAQHFQNAQLGTANQTTAGNLRDLNSNWGTYLNQYKNEKSQLLDQQNQDLKKAEGQYNDTRDQLNLILDRIGNRSVPTSDVSGALSGLNIPSVNYIQPTYTGTTPVYQAPNLSTFEASTPAASFAQPSAVSNSAATPALAFLLNQQKQKQQPTLA